MRRTEEQVMMMMEGMKVSEQQTTRSLKDMDRCMNNLLTKELGMKESKLFICSKAPQMNYVRTLKVAKETKRDKINKDVRKVQQLLSKLYEEINVYQKKNYEYVRTKKRYIENERDENDKKKRRLETVIEAREAEVQANTRASASVSMVDILKNEEDEEDLSAFPDSLPDLS